MLPFATEVTGLRPVDATRVIALYVYQKDSTSTSPIEQSFLAITCYIWTHCTVLDSSETFDAARFNSRRLLTN